MTDIGANTLFLLAYYGLSLLWDEYAATGSTDMKFVPYGGTSVSFHGNNRFPSWERPFPLMGTTVSLNGNEIGLRVSVGHMEPLLYVLLSYGY